MTSLHCYTVILGAPQLSQARPEAAAAVEGFPHNLRIFLPVSGVFLAPLDSALSGRVSFELKFRYFETNMFMRICRDETPR